MFKWWLAGLVYRGIMQVKHDNLVLYGLSLIKWDSNNNYHYSLSFIPPMCGSHWTHPWEVWAPLQEWMQEWIGFHQAGRRSSPGGKRSFWTTLWEFNISVENHHCYCTIPLLQWSFPIAILNYQRVLHFATRNDVV